MQRIDTSTAVADLFGAGKKGFRDGDPMAGVAPTDLNGAWFNALQEELANIVEADGTALNPADRTQVLTAIRKRGGVASTITVYAAPGTYTYVVPAGVYRLKVRVWSGGGGGAGSTASANGGGGGGGGGYAEKVIVVTPGDQITIVVGAGGTGGAPGANNGAPGGTSSVGAFVSVTGGTAGSATLGTSAPGGDPTGADFGVIGGWGFPASASTAGNGGSAPGGGAAVPGGGTGLAGLSPGGGGTGGGANATAAGFAGAPGTVIIEV